MLTAPTRRPLVFGALAGATALIALTARMQTGRSHAVTATAEAPRAIADLNGVPSLAVLPDGGTLSLDVQSPTEVDASTVQLDAAIALAPAATPSQALVFTLDFSSSTFTTPGGCGGDFNSDGLTDTVLDCELAAALDTIQRAGDWGVADAGIVIFETIGQSADVRPQGGTQRFTAPDADLDADGVLDLETVLRSAGQFPGLGGRLFRWLDEFSRRTVSSILGGGTNYREAARETCRNLTFTSQPQRTVLWLSDGQANFGGTVNTQLPCATPATIHTLAVGSGSSCTTDPRGYGSLEEVAALGGGTCTQVTDPSQLADVLQGLVLPGIDRVTLTVNGGAELDVSDSVDATLPQRGAVTLAFSRELAGIANGDELCLTVYSTDPASGAETSLSECITVDTNAAPLADAGPDLVVTEGELATLDGSGSADPDGDPLTYRWEIEAVDGPVLVIPGEVLPTTVVQTLDDGDYVLTLTVSDGAFTASDTATLTVLNDAPVASAEIDGAMAEGIALLTAAFTEEGVIDTHTASVDWGDGSPAEAVSVSAQGTGWGSLFASHVFSSAGTFSVSITVTDDDGGTDTETVNVTITPTVGIFATATSGNAFDWTGGSGTIDGLVHSNAGVRVRGASKSLTGGVEYVTTASLSSSATISPTATVATVQDSPIAYALDDYAPGGRAAVQAGASFHDMTSACTSTWRVSTELTPGLYYAPCDVVLQGTQSEVTVVSTGSIQVSRQGSNLRPFADGLLFYASGDVEISAANGTYLGHVVSGGTLRASGSGNRFLCGSVAEVIDLSGSSVSIEGSDCVRPDRTTAPPTLVPSLDVALVNSPDAVNPSALVTSTVTVENGSALLLVPGIVGLQNHGTTPVTVMSGDVTLEVLEVGATEWTEIPTTATLVTAPNAATGVTYVGDGFADAVLAAGSLASWGAQLQVELDPSTAAWLLDETRVEAVRTHVEFTVDDPTAPVRTLYRFGDDIAQDLRDAGSAVTSLQVTLTTVDGSTRVIDASASLAAGETARASADGAAPSVAAIGAHEDADAYLARLLAFDGAGLGALVSVRAEGGVGHVLGPQTLARATLEVPVVDAEFEVPNEVVAGDALSIDAAASTVSATTAWGPTASLGLSGATSSSAFVSPLPSGSIDRSTLNVGIDDALSGLNPTLTTSWSWSDAAGNTYGPASVDHVVFVGFPAALDASLTDELADDVAGDGVVGAGDSVRYSGTVRNTGTASLAGVVVELPLDANTSLVPGSATASQGGVTEAGASVTFALGTLDGMETASLEVEARIVDPVPEGVGELSAQGTVTASGAEAVLTDDPGAAGDEDPTTTPLSTDGPVVVATLYDELVVDADLDGEPSAGDTLRYVAEMQVVGETQASAVVFDLAPDARSPLVAGSVQTDTGTIVLGNGSEDTTVRIEVGDLAGGSFATLVFEVTVAGGPGASLSAQGTIGGDGFDDVLTDDPDTEVTEDATVTELGGTVDGPGSPQVTLSAPEDGSRVAAPTELVATTSPEGGTTVASWRAVLYPSGGDASEGATILSGSGDLPASLGTFDPTLLENGAWTVRVEVTDSMGRIGTGEVDAVVDGAMKLGSYDLAFVDAEWHSSITAITLLRSYSTLRKDTVGDFGHGWRLSMLDFQVQRNGPLGDGGWSQEACGEGFIYFPVCTVSSAPHLVTVRWPDGHVEAWDLEPVEGSSYFATLTTAAFTPRPGTTSTLEPADGANVAYYGDSLYADITLGEIYDPQQYWLTARDGTMYLLDLDDGLVEMVDRHGNSTEFTDAGIVPERGVGVDFVRDSIGRITSIQLPDGSTLAYTYDGGDLASVTDQVGDTVDFAYDDHLLVAYTHTGYDPVAVMSYDADGRLVSTEDALGVFTIRHTDLDAFSSTTITGGLTTTETYDNDGLLTTIAEEADGEQRVTAFTYDDNYRVESATSPEGALTTWIHDDDGNLLEAVDPDGVVTEHTYDAGGHLLSTTVGGERKSSATYDAAGNLLERYDADDRLLESYTYSAWGGVERMQNANGLDLQFSYDDRSQVDGFVVNGRTIELVLDAYGVAVGMVDDVGASGVSSFDARGRLIGHEDANGHTEGWAYDSRGLIVSRTDKAARTGTYRYADDGTPLAETTRAGAEITYTYDDGGYLTGVDGGDAWVAYTYDGFGQTMQVANPNQTITYTYDLDGNVMSEATSGSGYAPTGTTYSWSAGGRLLSSTNAWGTRTWTYDAQGRPATLDDSRTGTTRFTWDTSDRLEEITRSTGLVTSFSYTSTGQIETIRDEADGVLVDEQTYEHDADGRVITRFDGQGTHAYDYDARGRLVEATRPSGSGIGDEAYDYDANGNRVASTVGGLGSFVADLLVEDDAYYYDYDEEGRLASREDRATGELTTYSWDAFDQLLAVHYDNGTETTFAYDGLSRRIAIDHLGDTTQLVYDGDDERAALTDGVLVSWLSTGFDGRLLSDWRASTGAVRDVIRDNINTRTAWVTAGVADRTARDSFGYGATPEEVDPHAMTWHAQDPTGLVHARSRYYDPATGRFLSEDPYDAANLYTYAHNDPVNRWDPQGTNAAAEYANVGTRGSVRVAPGSAAIGIAVACVITLTATSVGSLAADIAINGPGPVEWEVVGPCEGRFTSKCFEEDTPVQVPDGTAAIQELEVGDLIVAYGGEPGPWLKAASPVMPAVEVEP